MERCFATGTKKLFFTNKNSVNPIETTDERNKETGEISKAIKGAVCLDFKGTNGETYY